MSTSSFVRITVATICALLLAALPERPLRAQSPPAVRYTVPGMEKVSVRRNIPYRVERTDTMLMDIYTPPGPAGAARTPAVIFVHGGFFAAEPDVPPKDWEMFQSYGRLVAASGLAGVTFNHRYYGWGKAALERSFGDVGAAIGFVRQHAAEYGIDSDRLALWVFSGGGPHLAIPLRDSTRGLQCFVAYSPLMDLRGAARAQGVDTTGGWMDAFMPETYLGATGAALPPTLIVRAGMDDPGLLATIDHFVARALSQNEAIEVQTHPDGVHDFDVRNDDERTRQIISRTLDFVRTSTRGALRDPGAMSAGKLYSALLHGDVAGVKAFCAGRGRGEEAVTRLTAENTLNLAGYLLLQQGNVTAAVDVFRWVVDLYPDSPNAYDSLGDGFEASGQAELALENAKRCLEMLEKDTLMPEALKAAIYRSASGKVERLSGSPRR